jgi:methionine-rich copper-binding protein CopC
MARIGWRLLTATLAAAVLAAGVLAIGASSAWAHNVLKSTSPEDKATVAHTPSNVVLTFDEPAIAIGTKLVVTGPTGPVQVGAPQLVDNTVTQNLQPGAPAGAYTVEWRITSADGHPISGVFAFTARAAGDGTGGASSSATPSTALPQGRGLALLLIAVAFVVLAAGLVVFSRRRMRDRQPQK